MVANTGAYRVHQNNEQSLLDDAVTVWVVLEAGADVLATPENKAQHAQAKVRLAELLQSAGLDERDLRTRLDERRAARPRTAG